MGRDEFSGLQGPSAGRNDIHSQLLDYVIETFFPCVQQAHRNRKDRNMAFFREVRIFCVMQLKMLRRIQSLF